ncbi:TVP38/TMEM64 family protein [Acetobacterium sp. KB-1]|nr:TVP38/TMEM64 family protein [Acetobacterium sp. KB-1]
MKQREKQLKIYFLILFLLLLLVTGVFLAIGFFRGYFGSLEAFRTYIDTFGPFAPLMLTAIQTMQAFLPIIPSFFGFAAGAGLFGAFGGFLCNYIGISLGSIIAYYLARRFGIRFVKQIIPEKKYNAVVEWAASKKSYTIILFLSILLPLAPDCALCYFSGLINMPTKKYILIIVTAKPWCILLYSIFFSNVL